MNNTQVEQTALVLKANLYKEELNELVYKAVKINYKNKPPKLPHDLTSSTFNGFKKRFSNWKQQLLILDKERSFTSISLDPHLLTNFVK